MSINVFWFHAAVLGIGIFVAYFMHRRTMCIKSAFDLYRVRDRLIALVASGALEEESLIFKHYYSRINTLLSKAPNVGIDDILMVMLHKFEPDEFDQLIEKAEARVKKLKSMDEFKNQDVRDAVADYYSAVGTMILSHSSVLRAAYIVSKYTANHLITKVIPARTPIYRGLEAVGYTEREAQLFAS